MSNQSEIKRRKNVFSTKTLVKIGVLSAIAGVLMLFEIPLWFAPSFYKIDLSEVAVLLGGFALGPLPALFIELIKILINFIVNGTETAGIGELANLIMGLSFVLPPAFIYKYKHSFKYAVIGMIVGVVSFAVVGAIVNAFVLLPVYAVAFGIPVDALVAMGHAVNPAINDLNGLVILATTPFNLVKGVLTSIVTILLYKPLSKILHK